MCRWIALSIGLTVFTLAGCGGGNAAPEAAATTNVVQQNSPELAVAEFLEAVRTGQDDKASRLLTPLARQKTTEMELEVAPPGSDTAKYKVGEVEYVAEDGAHVASEWTDLDEEGQPHTDAIVWMVRREADGWRIAGMATRVFEDQPPLYLNFEDPEDMLRKQQLVAQEIERRSQIPDTGTTQRTTSAAPGTQSVVK